MCDDSTPNAHDERLTPSDALKVAAQCREEGYEELALVFEGIADKFAAFNERSPLTIEEIRARMGEEKFWQLWREMTESAAHTRDNP